MNFVDVTVSGSGDDARLVGAADWSIPLPSQTRAALGSANTRTLVAGFRPGAPRHRRGRVRASVRSGPGPTSWSTSATASCCTCSAADKDIVAIVDSEHRVQPGDIVNLVIPLEKLHLFDGETRRRDDAPAPGRGDRLTHDPSPDTPASAPRDDLAGADLVERVVDSQVLHRGRYLTFRVDTIERADGSRATRDIADHPGAVAILALDADDNVLMVRQFRLAAGQTLLEVPAGTLDVADDGIDRGPGPGRAARARGGDRDARRHVAHARALLHGARVHLGADDAVSRHGPARRPTTIAWARTRTSDSWPTGSRSPTRWPRPNAARSTTRSRSWRCSGWPACGRTRSSGAPSAVRSVGRPG